MNKEFSPKRSVFIEETAKGKILSVAVLNKGGMSFDYYDSIKDLLVEIEQEKRRGARAMVLGIAESTVAAATLTSCAFDFRLITSISGSILATLGLLDIRKGKIISKGIREMSERFGEIKTYKK